jgi:endonuclease YncB( thermonuclease family)
VLMRVHWFMVLIGAVVAVYLISLFPPPREDVRLTGRARIVDGDTIEVAGRRVRIFGIDAPEQDQTCERAAGGVWNCGAEATRVLRQIAGSQIVDCHVRATDMYDRAVALCRVGEEDLGRAMVRSGFAIRTSRRGEYAAEENMARAGRLGLWSGTFQNPKDWRAAHRDGAWN